MMEGTTYAPMPLGVIKVLEAFCINLLWPRAGPSILHPFWNFGKGHWVTSFLRVWAVIDKWLAVCAASPAIGACVKRCGSIGYSGTLGSHRATFYCLPTHLLLLIAIHIITSSHQPSHLCQQLT